MRCYVGYIQQVGVEQGQRKVGVVNFHRIAGALGMSLWCAVDRQANDQPEMSAASKSRRSCFDVRRALYERL